MAYTLQFGKSDTLAEDLAAEAVTATLTSGNFTDFTTDYLVIDYDVPAKREVIKCDVSSTAITNITRAQEGTSDVAHSAGAKVIYAFVPSHYSNGLGTIAENDAWTAWTPSLYKNDGTTSLTGTVNQARYIQIGKMVHAIINATGINDPNATARTKIYFDLPVDCEQHNILKVIGIFETNNGTAFATGPCWIAANGTNKAYVNYTGAAADWGTDAGENQFFGTFCYESD